MTQNQPGSGPTALRILLGSQLRRLREGKGVTREEAGHLIRGSESKISRMELGRVGFKERDVADLLTLYGVVDNQARAAVLDLVATANEPGWWHRFNDILPTWFQAYVGLEEAAARIRSKTSRLDLVFGAVAGATMPPTVEEVRLMLSPKYVRRRCPADGSAGR